LISSTVVLFFGQELRDIEVLHRHHRNVCRHLFDFAILQLRFLQWLIAVDRSALLASFDDRVGDLASNQSYRANRIIV